VPKCINVAIAGILADKNKKTLQITSKHHDLKRYVEAFC
jgi:hypothetical protein